MGRQQGGGNYAGGGGPGGVWDGSGSDGLGRTRDWNGTADPRGLGSPRPEDFQAAYRDALRSLQQLQQQSRQDPAAARDIQGLVNRLRQLDPFAGSNDPLLGERIQAALANVEQVELELRRKLDDAGGRGAARSPGAETVPQGFAGQVAEYFRKLSKSK
jgi:hypothetical protein